MWLELHDSVRDHPKLIKAARDLGIPKVHLLGHLTSLWTWTLRMAPDGDLSSFDAEDIEIGAEWTGETGKLVEALVHRGWLDRDDDTDSLTVHDWDGYARHLKAAEWKRQERLRKKAQKREADIAVVTNDVPTMSDDTNNLSPDIVNLSPDTSGIPGLSPRPTRPTRPDQTDKETTTTTTARVRTREVEPAGGLPSAKNPVGTPRDPDRSGTPAQGGIVDPAGSGATEMATTGREASGFSNLADDVMHGCRKVIALWNRNAPLSVRVPKDGTNAIDRNYSGCVNGSPPVLHDEILGAIENYGMAVRLPNSQAGEHSLGTFLVGLLGNPKHDTAKYLPGNFNLKNFDSKRFARDGPTDADTFDAEKTQKRLESLGLL